MIFYYSYTLCIFLEIIIKENREKQKEGKLRQQKLK
jgi:hypothetical protein